ncbi:MAG: MinD/ParA family protein [Alphaproteobacteria bacterium]|nr:MinD/ParA family protein [Alphaproteobacteria bacterium]
MNNPIPFKASKAPTSTATLRCANMLAVASGKGGVGKTWFAVTLSQALARRGKRVLLFDGDLGLANVDIQLGLTPDKDLANVIEDRMLLADAVMRYTEGSFDILAGHSGSGNLASLTPQKIADLRDALIAIAPRYDHVIIDLGAGVDRAVRQMAGPAAVTYVVVTDEPTSLTDAYAFIKLAHAANPRADLRVVVNMAGSANDGRKTYEILRKACESFLRMTPPLAGVIRRDAKVRDAIRAQTPLLTRSPSCEAANDVEAIAAGVPNV